MPSLVSAESGEPASAQRGLQCHHAGSRASEWCMSVYDLRHQRRQRTREIPRDKVRQRAISLDFARLRHAVQPQWGSGGRGFKSRRPDSRRATPQRFTAVAFCLCVQHEHRLGGEKSSGKLVGTTRVNRKVDDREGVAKSSGERDLWGDVQKPDVRRG